MKEIFSNITQKERRQLAAAAVLLGLTLLFYVFGSATMRRSYRNSADILVAAERSVASAEESLALTEANWLSWEQATSDMAELRENYFYTGEEWLKQVRLDLQRILDRSSVLHSQKSFQYARFEKEGIEKVGVEFNVTGSYDSLKAFMHAIERFPRFLIIERIDFLDIDPQGLGIKVRVLLAGYRAQF